MQIERFEQQSEEKQRALLAAGMEEFADRSYADASTDAIVRRCGISKGLLFHYFGSKKAFYGYCLRQALERLTAPTAELSAGGFYDILFGAMEQKLRLCAQYPSETRFVNMASRETSGEAAACKAEAFAQYAARKREESAAILRRAVAMLPVRESARARAADALQLYCGAILNRYLLAYQERPDAFFARAPQLKAELREMLDLMLYGIVEEEQR